MLVAIEGADGAGKHTAATRLCGSLNAAGRRAIVIAFPRYGETIGGITIGRFLAGELPVPVTPRAAAVLYALDRLESRDAILTAAEAHDVVIFDRYLASNMAYQAAKVAPEEARAMMDWILALETERFALPLPALSIYLDTPWEIARALILQKARRSYTERDYDEHEADVALQQRVRANYEAMVEAGLAGPWRVVAASDAGTMRAPDAIVTEIRAQMESISSR
ncbi:MAG: thymidylate kinase [Sphingomonas sp.]